MPEDAGPSCAPGELLWSIGWAIACCIGVCLALSLAVPVVALWSLLGLILTAHPGALLTVGGAVETVLGGLILSKGGGVSPLGQVWKWGVWDGAVVYCALGALYVIMCVRGTLPRARLVFSGLPVGSASFFVAKLAVVEGDLAAQDLRLRLAFLWVALLVLSFSYGAASRIWVDASYEQLISAEAELLERYCPVPCDQAVIAGLGTVYPKRNVEPGAASRKPDLVLIHGYASGNAFWSFNIAELSKKYRVWCVEHYGCGRSDRGPFRAKHPEEAEAIIVGALERWRQEVGLGNILVCGHSLGAMFASAYALAHPSVVTALVLASPVGVGPLPEGWEERGSKTLVRKILAHLWERGLTPMMPIRWMGPLGPSFARKLFEARRSWATPDDSNLKALDLELFSTYIYQNWALHPSGERALNAMLHPGAYARVSLTENFIDTLSRADGDSGRKGEMRKLCPVIFIYGDPEFDWMEAKYGHSLADTLRSAGGHAEVYTVSNAGHQLFLDNSAGFNRTLAKALSKYTTQI